MSWRRIPAERDSRGSNEAGRPPKLVDYPNVWAVKLNAFAALFAEFQRRHAHGGETRYEAAAFHRFVAGGKLMAGPEKKDAFRWEWRTFSSSLSDIEAKIGLAVQIAPRQSDEVYLLNSATPHSAKIRNGVLEVKRLEQVDSSGLELWNPAFKAAFPLSTHTLQLAFAALDLPPPVTRPADYDLDEFLTEVISHNEALRAVPVKKARRQFVFRTCAAEFVGLHIGAIAQESFCLENEDPTSVIAALRELGLDPHANISFPKGLARALALSGLARIA